MSKYDHTKRTKFSGNFDEIIKSRYPQKEYDIVPKRASIEYYLSVLVINKPNNLLRPDYININNLNPNEPSIVENMYIRKSVNAIINIGYKPYPTFNILLRICYKQKYDDNPPYFQLSILVYVFHTIIKKNATSLTELFISQFYQIKDYLIECCYGNVDKGIVVYRPIEIAAFYGNIDAFKHLISNGAKYDIKNSLNETLRESINAGLIRLESSSEDDISKFFHKDNYSSCLDFLESMERSLMNEN